MCGLKREVEPIEHGHGRTRERLYRTDGGVHCDICGRTSLNQSSDLKRGRIARSGVEVGHNVARAHVEEEGPVGVLGECHRYSIVDGWGPVYCYWVTVV